MDSDRTVGVGLRERSVTTSVNLGKVQSDCGNWTKIQSRV